MQGLEADAYRKKIERTTYKNRIKSERWDRADSKIATPPVL